MNISKDIWKSLRKLSKKEASKLEGVTDFTLPSGFVTDGNDNIYEIPKEGYTDYFTVDDHIFSYNWEEQRIDLYADIEGNLEYIDSSYVSAPNFLDGPEYWCRVMLSENEILIENALNDLNDLLDTPAKTYYEYNIVLDTPIIPSNNRWDEISMKKHMDDYKERLSHFEQSDTVYGETLTITLSYDEDENITTIHVKYPLPLTENDIFGYLYKDIDIRDMLRRAISSQEDYDVAFEGIKSIIEV